MGFLYGGQAVNIAIGLGALVAVVAIAGACMSMGGSTKQAAAAGPPQDTSVVFVPRFKVPARRMARFKATLQGFYDSIQPEAESLFYYGFTIDEANGTVMCREAYKNADGLLAHLQNVDAVFKAMIEDTPLASLEVHGPKHELDKLRDALAPLSCRFFGMDSGSRLYSVREPVTHALSISDRSLLLVLNFTIPEGKKDEFVATLPKLYNSIQAQQESMLYYGFSLSEDDGSAVCRSALKDADGLLAHLEHIDVAFKAAQAIAPLASVELHGPAGELAKAADAVAPLNCQCFTADAGCVTWMRGVEFSIGDVDIGQLFKDVMIGGAVLVQESLLIEDGIRRSPLVDAIGACNLLWVIAVIWNFVIIIGWTFVPGTIAFYKDAGGVAAGEYCGAWASVFTGRMIVMLTPLFFFLNIASTIQWVIVKVVHSSAVSSAMLGAAQQADRGAGGIPVVQTIVKAFLLRAGHDTKKAKLTVALGEKLRLSKERDDAQLRLQELKRRIDASKLERKVLRTLANKHGDGMESNLQALECAGEESTAEWKKLGEQLAKQAEARAQGSTQAATEQLERVANQVTQLADSVKNSKAYQTAMEKAKAAIEEARVAAEQAQKAAAEAAEQAQEAAAAGLEQAQTAAASGLEQAQSMAATGVEQAQAAALTGAAAAQAAARDGAAAAAASLEQAQSAAQSAAQAASGAAAAQTKKVVGKYAK